MGIVPEEGRQVYSAKMLISEYTGQMGKCIRYSGDTVPVDYPTLGVWGYFSQVGL